MISFQPNYYVSTPALLRPSRDEFGYQSSAVSPCFFNNNLESILGALKRHNYAAPQPPRIKTVEDQRSYYVKMSKKSGDFSDYGVKVYQDQRFTHLWVYSTADNVKRHFKYPRNAVDYDAIQAKVARNGQFLLIQIPKVQTPEVVLNIVQKRLHSIANQERKEREELERRELQRKAAIERNMRLQAVEEEQFAAHREYLQKSLESAFSPIFTYRLESKQEPQPTVHETARPNVIRIPVNHVEEDNEDIPTRAPKADVEEEVEQFSDFEGFSDNESNKESANPTDEAEEDSDNDVIMDEPEILKRRPSPYSISYPSKPFAESTSSTPPSKTKIPNKIPIEEVEDEEFRRFSSSSDSDC